MNSIAKKLFQACDIPKDLDSVISIDKDKEVNPKDVGLNKVDVDAIWNKTLALYKQGAHPAISLSIRHRGQLLVSRSVGHVSGNGPKDSEFSKKIIATTDTPYCIFSTSKGITALLMHMLVEDGLINIMDPVAFYTPEFAQHGKENITIHQILAHRGGIPGLPANATVETLWDETEVWKQLCEAKPIITDGSQLAYHAITGGFVLEQVVKKVTGKSINDYIDTRIRKPMGMKFFSYGIEPEYLKLLATNYHTGIKPGLLLGRFIKRALGEKIENIEQACNDPRFQKAVIPSGNLAATANEVSAFFQMMLDKGIWNGKKICREETVARATQEYGNRTFDRTLMLPMRYSAGLMLGDEPFGIWGPRSKQSFGHLGLINKFCWADPLREMSVALLNSGIPILGPHIGPLVGLIKSISDNIPVTKSSQTFALRSA